MSRLSALLLCMDRQQHFYRRDVSLFDNRETLEQSVTFGKRSARWRRNVSSLSTSVVRTTKSMSDETPAGRSFVLIGTERVGWPLSARPTKNGKLIPWVGRRDRPNPKIVAAMMSTLT